MRGGRCQIFISTYVCLWTFSEDTILMSVFFH